jgi:WD40 repeat protein
LPSIFPPTERMVASGASDHAVKLWDIASGRLLTTLASASRHGARGGVCPG